MTTLCPVCNNKTLLGRAYIEYIVPDQEPYESDKIEDIDEITGIGIPLDIHWCEACQKALDIEIDESCLIHAKEQANSADGKPQPCAYCGRIGGVQKHAIGCPIVPPLI